jgi:hypothetical protein
MCPFSFFSGDGDSLICEVYCPLAPALPATGETLQEIAESSEL